MDYISKWCEAFWRACTACSAWRAIQRLVGGRAEKCVFIAGLLTYLLFQGTLVAVPLWTQPVIPQFDDAYAYINKSEQLKVSPRQDCLALEDLREQLGAPPSNPAAALFSHRMYHRVLFSYHPLYSALLLALERTGLTYESAFKWLWTAGAVFVWLSLAYWLRALWRPAPAGIALAMLSLQVFEGHGFHWIFPSELALGAMLFVWTRLIARRGHAPWSLIVGTILLVSLHPAGRIYAAALVVLAVLLAGWPRTLRAAWPQLATVLIIAVGLLLATVIHRPELSIRLVPWPKTLSEWVPFALGSAAGVGLVLARSVTPLSAVPVALAILFGYRTAADDESKSLVKSSALVVALTATSLLSVTYPYPAEVFRRVWLLLAALLAGAIGQSVWYLVAHMRVLAVRLLQQSGGAPLSPGTASEAQRRGWIKLSALAACLLIAAVVQLATGGLSLATTMYRMGDYQTPYDITQPARLVALTKPGDRVLYLHEVLLLIYLTHGGLNAGVVYYPAIAGTPTEARWLRDPSVRFAVAWNPVQSLKLLGAGGIQLDPLRELRVETPAAVPVNQVRLLVENKGGPVQAKAQSLAPDGGEPVLVSIPARTSGWVAANWPRATQTRLLALTFPPNGSQLRLLGLTMGDDSKHWPWAQKARLTLTPRELTGVATTLSFDPAELLPDILKPVGVEVLDDTGASVVLGLQH